MECNDTDVVVWTAASNVRLSQLAVSNKSLTVHGFEVSWKPSIPPITTLNMSEYDTASALVLCCNTNAPTDGWQIYFQVILDTLVLKGMNLTVIAPIVNCGISPLTPL